MEQIDYSGFVRDRISTLLRRQQLSENKLSRDLGHRESYINGITSGRQMVPMEELFRICEYFRVTPQQFFDSDAENPLLLAEAMDGFKQLKAPEQEAILTIIHSLNDR